MSQQVMSPGDDNSNTSSLTRISKLSGPSNWLQWKMDIKMVLIHQDLWDVVDPDTTTNLSPPLSAIDHRGNSSRPSPSFICRWRVVSKSTSVAQQTGGWRTKHCLTSSTPKTRRANLPANPRSTTCTRTQRSLLPLLLEGRIQSCRV